MKNKKENLLIRYYAGMGVMLLGIFLVYIGALSGGIQSAALWIGFGLTIVASILWFTVRCPNCHCHLAGRRGLPKFCPNCGVFVQDKENEA